MSLWQRIKGRAGRPEEPTRRDVLAAHIDAFRERYAEASRNAVRRGADGRLALSVLAQDRPSRVVVQLGLDRLELVATREGFSLRLFPDVFFPGSVDLGEDKRAVLGELGLCRDRAGCFATEFDADAASRSMCDAIEAVLFRVLDHGRDAFYGVSIEPERRPDNSDLIDSIQALVKARDLDARRLVYQAFINALLYVPLTAPEDRSLPARVRASSGGGLVDKGEEWTVYSDEDAFRRGGLGSEDVALVSGVRLVHAAEAEGIVALKINPRSRIGGEFLRNELWMMGDYLRKIGVLSP